MEEIVEEVRCSYETKEIIMPRNVTGILIVVILVLLVIFLLQRV